ncbi:MAG: hypothetical protein PHX82_16500, partial [Paracoccaceae bacterium]|nr:hypothetical protein [Paracoccaceae bacterium]
TLAVLGLAYWQFHEAGVDKTRERSMALVTEWAEGGQADRLGRVNEYLSDAGNRAKKQIDAMAEDARDLGWKNAETAIYGALAVPVTSEARALRRDLDQIFAFFTRAEICVSSGLCDAEVMRAYFLVEAQSLTRELALYLVLVHKAGFPTYGAGAEAFVTAVEN